MFVAIISWPSLISNKIASGTFELLQSYLNFFRFIIFELADKVIIHNISAKFDSQFQVGISEL